ncbi:MAG: hypothetical protein Q4E47_02000 [Candidatus Saccharibacteria bacterium]|nr:hypothetical protein [Candidatus Saccharibacteria bacterium]
MENNLHEPITVTADFFPIPKKTKQKSPRCIPKSFKLSNGREVFITEIGLIHPRFDGLKTHFLFDVTDDVNDYRISFDTETLEWFLEWEGDSDV